MSHATSADAALVALVVGLRFIVPLLIPRWPLPAILACLIIDGVDQTVFQTFLSHGFWSQIEHGYQGYDKALDVYYLSMAYLATMRNWTNPTALVTAQFLWIYRLVGVAIFEIAHDIAEPSSYRWVLLVFPNTFEYFFIAYEVVRLRWDPRRMAPRLVVGMAAAIWIFIKLPQEWWIHIAQLDMTDEMAAHPWIIWVMVIGCAAIVAIAWWMITYRLPPADWTRRIGAPPIPPPLATARLRSGWSARRWRLWDWNLVEKVVLVTLTCVIFAEILPGVTESPAQVAGWVAAIIVVNAMGGLAFVRRGHTIDRYVMQFLAQLVVTEGIIWVASLVSSRFRISHALLFVLLITLITTLYDRYRPVREFHRLEARGELPEGAEAAAGSAASGPLPSPA